MEGVYKKHRLFKKGEHFLAEILSVKNETFKTQQILGHMASKPDGIIHQPIGLLDDNESHAEHAASHPLGTRREERVVGVTSGGDPKKIFCRLCDCQKKLTICHSNGPPPSPGKMSPVEKIPLPRVGRPPTLKRSLTREPRGKLPPLNFGRTGTLGGRQLRSARKPDHFSPTPLTTSGADMGEWLCSRARRLGLHGLRVRVNVKVTGG